MDLLNLTEAAKASRICKRTLTGLIADGQGPRLTRIGHKIFVSAPHLAEWHAAMADPEPKARGK
jgi:hypothetical protein